MLLMKCLAHKNIYLAAETEWPQRINLVRAVSEGPSLISAFDNKKGIFILSKAASREVEQNA